MKTMHISIIAILISTTTIVPIHALEAATPQNNDTITTSAKIVGIRTENCDFKETFLVSGTIGMPLGNSPAQIRIYNPNGTIYDSERIPSQQILPDGKYWYLFNIIYGNATLVGPYDITVSYNGQSARTSVHLVGPSIIRGQVPNTLRIVDSNGNNLTEVRAGQQVQIEDSVQPPMCSDPQFAYIVQVQDKNAATVSLSWIEGTFDKDKPMNFSETWMPITAGSYTIQRYLWQSIENPNSLSPPVSTDLTVWPSLSDYTRSTIRNGENFQCQSGYELVIKSNNNSTACVTPSTASKLVEHGWGTFAASSIDGTGNQEKNGTLSGNVARAGGPRSGPQLNYEVDVYADDGITIVGKTLSDYNGNYSIQLPAGNYVIYAPDYPARQTHFVSVTSGKNTVLDIIYGTGYK